MYLLMFVVNYDYLEFGKLGKVFLFEQLAQKKDGSRITEQITNPLQTYAETIIIHQYDLKY